MGKSFISTSIFIAALLFSSSSNAQIQKGITLTGGNNSYFGSSVSMPDSNTLIIGAPITNAGAGAVRVYHWINSGWVQKGITLTGENDSYFGSSVSMPDSNTLIVGIPYANANTGAVRVYRWIDSGWVQKGITLTGGNNSYFGSSVSMPDSNTLIVGAAYANADSGIVKVYRWNNSGWVQKGITLTGGYSSYFGASVSMPDSNTLIVGAPDANAYAGAVRVYRWADSGWVQKGSTLTGGNNSRFGTSVSMPDSNTLIIGAPITNAGAGAVRVYHWINSGWVQKGITLTGENDSYFGSSVSMPDSNTLIVGIPYANANTGAVRVYRWIDTDWVQKGITLTGENYSMFGYSVSMPDSNTLIVGSIGSASVSVYTFLTYAVISPTVCNSFTSPGGKVWTTSGIYKDTIPNTIGGDSIITINLTVNRVNASITQHGNTLTANDSNATYQWITCSGMPIFGDTDQTFTALTNGYYAVIVSHNGCIDTSICASVSTTGISQNNIANLQMYPNPTNGILTITTGRIYSQLTVEVTDELGRLVEKTVVKNKQKVRLNLDGAAGVYFIHITTASGKTMRTKVIKE